MAGRPLLSQYQALSATRYVSSIGEKEEELCAFAYGGGNGVSGVVEDISQGRLDGIKYGCETKAHGASRIK